MARGTNVTGGSWRTLLGVLFAGWLSLEAGPTPACNIPVFRYALENWPGDPYEAFVFHRGPLSGDDRAAVAPLEKAAGVTLRVVDLDRETDESLREVFEDEPSATLPWLVVRYPAATRVRENAWSGPLQPETVRALLDSPARRQVADRILSGDSAVWVLLESGSKEQDDAAESLLRAQLHTLEETLKLPPRTPAPEDQPAHEAVLPLRLAFSVLRVARTDPAERLLVPLLLHTEPDLSERQEPIVFPIFGRGRVLYALVGPGINEGTLHDTALFLTGACSCQVKRENPGVDLLLTADWSGRLEGHPDGKPAAPPAPATRPEPTPGRAEPDPAPAGSGALTGLLLLLLALALITAAVFFLRARRQGRP
jgi:hypothetical protein